MRLMSSVFVVCMQASIGWAATINVPGDHPTIQDAVDAAAAGDEVVVAPGNWTGSGDSVIDLLGKSITVRSSNGPGTTIIDGQGARRGVSFSGGETADTVLKGFTITNGLGTGSFFEGGGILCAANASPTIVDCTVTGNLAWRGSGMMIRGSASITGCQITGNNTHDNTSPNSYGGGIYCLGEAVITNCDISDNGSYWGAGVTLQDCDAQLVDCTISGNSAVQGGAVYVRNQSPVISGCSLHGNNAEYGGATYLFTDSSPSFLDCSIHSNTASGFAGAVAAYLHGAAIFDNCSISSNSSAGIGGGFWIYGSSANMEITNCAITSNACIGTGGAFYSDLGLITMTGTLVCDNTLDQLDGPWTDGGGNDITEFCVVGACCDGLDCSLLTQVECDAIAGSTWLGDGSICDDCLSIQEGACCLVEGLRAGACVIADPVSCEDLDGDWQGADTDCTACIPPPQSGACCLIGGCIQLWQDECLAIGGNWLGDNTGCDTCPEPGACCLSTGCLQSWEQDCIAAGGDWYVGGVCDDCPPPPEPGTCCLGCELCLVMSIDDCDGAGGQWLGVGGDCADCPPPCIGDTNGDEVVDILDLMNVIGYWGPCP